MIEAEAATQSDVIAVAHTLSTSARYTHVEWMLGNTCTYACSYCPPKLHDGSVRWLNYDHVIAFISRLDHHYRQLGKEIWLQYTGGEPTIYPQFIPLIAEGRRRGFSQSVISNGVRTVRFWRDAVPFLDYVILTYHVEFVDSRHFFEVIDAIRDRVAIHVNVTMLPERFAECQEAAMRLHDTYEEITITMKPLRLEFQHDLYDYTDEQMTVLRRQFGPSKEVVRHTPRTTMTKMSRDGSAQSQAPNAFVVKGENRWKGWRCAAGVESLRIMADGTVFRSQCRVGGRLGSIEGGVAFPRDLITCDRERCSCISDILLTKYRSEATVGR